MPIETSANRNAFLPYMSDEDRWSAVLDREREADGKFYYSVETTGGVLPTFLRGAPAIKRERSIPCKLRGRGMRWVPALQAMPPG